MIDQTRKAEQFRGLHIPGKPLVLFNIWDAGSAKAVATSGAKAIATGSWSVAASPMASGFRWPWRSTICAVLSVRQTYL
jgi:2-methylisocitrate lyase-like PEP mutase family enzyme